MTDNRNKLGTKCWNYGTFDLVEPANMYAGITDYRSSHKRKFPLSFLIIYVRRVKLPQVFLLGFKSLYFCVCLE